MVIRRRFTKATRCLHWLVKKHKLGEINRRIKKPLSSTSAVCNISRPWFNKFYRNDVRCFKPVIATAADCWLSNDAIAAAIKKVPEDLALL